MSGSEEDIEKLRKKKMEQLQEQAQAQGGSQGGQVDQEELQRQQEQADAQKQALLRQHLTDGARKRLNSVRMSKPEFAEQVEQQIVALAQSGRLGDRIGEDQMKALLKELQPDDGGFNIRRR